MTRDGRCVEGPSPSLPFPPFPCSSSWGLLTRCGEGFRSVPPQFYRLPQPFLILQPSKSTGPESLKERDFHFL